MPIRQFRMFSIRPYRGSSLSDLKMPRLALLYRGSSSLLIGEMIPTRLTQTDLTVLEIQLGSNYRSLLFTTPRHLTTLNFIPLPLPYQMVGPQHKHSLSLLPNHQARIE